MGPLDLTRCFTYVNLIKLRGRIWAGLISAKNPWDLEETKLRTSWSDHKYHWKNEVLQYQSPWVLTNFPVLHLFWGGFWTQVSRNSVPFKAPSILGEEVPSLIYSGFLECLFLQKCALMVACVGELWGNVPFLLAALSLSASSLNMFPICGTRMCADDMSS